MSHASKVPRGFFDVPFLNGFEQYPNISISIYIINPAIILPCSPIFPFFYMISQPGSNYKSGSFLTPPACKWVTDSGYVSQLEMFGVAPGPKPKQPFPYAPCMVYLPTWLGDVVRANVGKYSSTMEHMGFVSICFDFLYRELLMPQGNNHLPLVGSCRFFWGEFEHEFFWCIEGHIQCGAPKR